MCDRCNAQYRGPSIHAHGMRRRSRLAVHARVPCEGEGQAKAMEFQKARKDVSVDHSRNCSASLSMRNSIKISALSTRQMYTAEDEGTKQWLRVHPNVDGQ